MSFKRRSAIDLQGLGRLGHTGHGFGLPHTGGGDCHGRATLYSQADPTVQLRVAISAPPLGCGPVCVLRGAFNRLVSGQGIGIEHFALGGNAAETDTAI